MDRHAAELPRGRGAHYGQPRLWCVSLSIYLSTYLSIFLPIYLSNNAFCRHFTVGYHLEDGYELGSVRVAKPRGRRGLRNIDGDTIAWDEQQQPPHDAARSELFDGSSASGINSRRHLLVPQPPSSFGLASSSSSSSLSSSSSSSSQGGVDSIVDRGWGMRDIIQEQMESYEQEQQQLQVQRRASLQPKVGATNACLLLMCEHAT